MVKPKKRTWLRVWVGQIYYTLKKQYYWNFSGKNFAKTFKNEFLPFEVFSHKTPILRKLEGVDMWMQHNKVRNIKLAIHKINKIIIKPGQTFSFWRQIGKPTRLKGYLPGMILHKGSVKTGIGGGLCQLSNLIFWMTLHTPLTIKQRFRHSYDVFPDVQRNQPFGSGATCAYPHIDLQIENNTKQDFQLCFEIKDGCLVGKYNSEKSTELKYNVLEKDHEIKNEWWGGYSRNNKIFREIFHSQTNTKLAEEFVVENHAIMMYNPFLDFKEK